VSYRLNTDDVYNLATFYELALKIGFALAKEWDFLLGLQVMLSNVRRWRMYAKSLLLNRSSLSHHAQGFFQMFVQGGGKYMYVSVCKLCGKLGGFGGMLPRESLILELLLDAIWWNLGLFSNKHNLPFYVIKAFIKA